LTVRLVLPVSEDVCSKDVKADAGNVTRRDIELASQYTVDASFVGETGSTADGEPTQKNRTIII
jgi:hypothetical protein